MKLFNSSRVIFSVFLTALLTLTIFSPTPLTSSASAKIDRSLKIALLYDSSGPGDGSYNDAALKALKAAKKKYRLYSPNVREVVTDGTLGDRIYRLRLMARSGYYLMIAVGRANAEAVRRVSLEYPELEFAIINDGTVSGLNVASLIFDDRQSAYMAGYAAALGSRSGKVLYIASEGVELQRLAPFFERGAKAAKPEINISTSNLFDDFISALSSDIDMVYTTWNLDSAILNQVIMLNRDRSKARQIKMIASIPDQYYTNLEIAKPHLYLSIKRDIEAAVDLVVRGAVADVHVLNLLDGENNIFGKRFNFANGGLGIVYHSAAARKKAGKLNEEIARIKAKRVKF